MLSEGKWQDYVVFDEEPELLRISFVGQWLNAEQSQQVRSHLRDTGLWRPERPVLMDLRRVTIAGTPPFAEMQRRTDAWKLLTTPPPRIAFVASPGANYGFARMLEQQWGTESIATFEGEAEARHWLLAGHS
jgi:hypothetical protein